MGDWYPISNSICWTANSSLENYYPVVQKTVNRVMFSAIQKYVESFGSKLEEDEIPVNTGYLLYHQTGDNIRGILITKYLVADQPLYDYLVIAWQNTEEKNFVSLLKSWFLTYSDPIDVVINKFIAGGYLKVIDGKLYGKIPY